MAVNRNKGKLSHKDANSKENSSWYPQDQNLNLIKTYYWRGGGEEKVKSETIKNFHISVHSFRVACHNIAW
jgi:hypothetical protein